VSQSEQGYNQQMVEETYITQVPVRRPPLATPALLHEDMPKNKRGREPKNSQANPTTSSSQAIVSTQYGIVTRIKSIFYSNSKLCFFELYLCLIVISLCNIEINLCEFRFFFVNFL
jgi:hypothetical protein